MRLEDELDALDLDDLDVRARRSRLARVGRAAPGILAVTLSLSGLLFIQLLDPGSSRSDFALLILITLAMLGILVTFAVGLGLWTLWTRRTTWDTAERLREILGDEVMAHRPPSRFWFVTAAVVGVIGALFAPLVLPVSRTVSGGALAVTGALLVAAVFVPLRLHPTYRRRQLFRVASVSTTAYLLIFLPQSLAMAVPALQDAFWPLVFTLAGPPLLALFVAAAWVTRQVKNLRETGDHRGILELMKGPWGFLVNTEAVAATLAMLGEDNEAWDLYCWLVAGTEMVRNRAVGWLMLGEIARERGDSLTAMGLFLLALEHRPDLCHAWAAPVETALDQGVANERVRELAERALEHGARALSGGEQYVSLAAWAEAVTGHEDRARTLITEAETALPDLSRLNQAIVRGNLAGAYGALGDASERIRHLEKVTELDPQGRFGRRARQQLGTA